MFLFFVPHQHKHTAAPWERPHTTAGLHWRQGTNPTAPLLPWHWLGQVGEEADPTSLQACCGRCLSGVCQWSVSVELGRRTVITNGLLVSHKGGGGGQEHVCCHFAWCSANSVYHILCERTALCFQYILKSMFHENTNSLVSQYTLLCACTELCMWPCSLSKNI